MNRYDWPVLEAEAEHDDDPLGRSRFFARQRLEFDARGVERALRGAPPAAPGTPRRPGTRAPATSRTHLWQPLGPQTVVGGQAEGAPRITGRINALAIDSTGERLYAASANGGVWYSGDGGLNWRSLAGLASTPTAGITRPAHRNACGAIAAVFGADETTDVVWVGTGEVSNPIDAQPGSSLGGIGILRADHPASSVEADPWKREAPNLIGNGVYKIVLEPGGSGVVAATRSGLFQRPASGAGPGVDWVRPAEKPFDKLDGHCTDALWTAADAATSRPKRLWVWVRDGKDAGLWVRSGNATEFLKVAVAAGSTDYWPSRAALAAATPPSQVWALNDAGDDIPPQLYRVTNGSAAPVATEAVGVPNILATQGTYDIAIDVDPNDADRVLLGGSFLATTTPESINLPQEGAVVVGHVAPNAGALTFGHPATWQMIGIGVHADIHGVYYANGGTRLFTCCDGGIFRSDRPTSIAGFYPVNEGLQVVESNYLAQHPLCEGYLALGLQDNASIQRHSSGVWTRVPRASGDGGGIMLQPLHPEHLCYQYVQANWSTSDGTMSDPDMLTRATAAGGSAFASRESKSASFYSSAAAIASVRTPAAPAPALDVGQFIFGTTRVWYTEQTRTQDAAKTETAIGTRWFTLPGGGDPLPADTDAKVDDFGQQITVCRWQSADVAWVLGEGKLARYSRTAGSDAGGAPGTWKAEPILRKSKKNKKDTTHAEGPVRKSPVWTDVAVNLDAGAAQRGTRGAVYLGTIGHPDDADVDTLWWFNGTDKWFKTGLRADGVPAPVTAIVCDSAFPDEVYVGTTVGVWKGVRTQIGNADPAWTWHPRLNGLPEAAVEDLAIFSDGGVRLLRAAIAARGAWELRLDTADVDDLTYLRAHDNDLRYRGTAVTLQRDSRTTRSWHASPDVRPRLAPAKPTGPTAAVSWNRNTAPTEALRRFQASMRSFTKDPRVRANGLWDAYFGEVLRDHGAPTQVVPAAGTTPAFTQVVIDKALFDKFVTGAHATAEAWSTPQPTEADLLDLTPELNEGEIGKASCRLPPKKCKVDIVVHHRGFVARDGADVRVTLLKWIDPKTKKAAQPTDSKTWFDDPVPWAGAVNDVLNSAAGTTNQSFGAGWSFVGTTNATRRRTLAGQTLDPLHSGVVTFDLDLTGRKNNSLVLLVAVIRAGGDVALTAQKLIDLAQGSHAVAVRAIHVAT